MRELNEVASFLSVNMFSVLGEQTCMEGFVVHQIAHLLLIVSFVYFYLKVRKLNFRDLNVFLLLFSFWGVLAFLKHTLELFDARGIYQIVEFDDIVLLLSLVYLTLFVRKLLREKIDFMLALFLAVFVNTSTSAIILGLAFYTFLLTHNLRKSKNIAFVEYMYWLCGAILLFALFRFASNFARCFAISTQNLELLEILTPIFRSMISVIFVILASVTMYYGYVERVHKQIVSINKELEKSNEHLILLNRILRHDITNDLNVIHGYIELYESIKDERYLNQAKSRIVHSMELIKKVKELESLVKSRGRVITGKDLKEMIKNILTIFPVKCTIDVHDSTKIKADDLLSSVIYNIVQNSFQHGGENVEVSIDCRELEDAVEIKITDTGKGIPPEIREKVFEEGFTYGNTGKTGLGLYLVKEAIERWGGSIEIKDNRPKGTVFVIRLEKINQ